MVRENLFSFFNYQKGPQFGRHINQLETVL